MRSSVRMFDGHLTRVPALPRPAIALRMTMANVQRTTLIVALLGLCAIGLPTGLSAQAPVITPAGDPSIDADTIYALATAAEDGADEAVAYLLNDAVLRLDAAGRGTLTYRQIVHVRRQQAVRAFAERRLRYSPDHQKLTLNWVRVVRPSGEVISEGPAQTQETDVAAAITNPVYVNQKELRLSLGGVAENTIVDISYTYEEAEPYLEGDFFTHWNVHASAPVPVLRSRFILELPAAVRPRITETNLNFAVQRHEADGRRTLTWAAADVPVYRPEPFAPDTNGVHMHVVASAPLAWQDIAHWYHGLAHERTTLTPALQAQVRSLADGATTRLDTIRAVHRWVAQDIRYVSVSLGLGGYQPRTPEQTVTTGFGDCKDKTTLFVAALRSLGIDAHPVLLHSQRAAVRPEHPSIRQFNHMIAAVRDGAGTTYTDLTAELTPYGQLPPSEHGGFALVVLPDGRGEEVRLPRPGADERRIDYSIVTTLDENGQLSGVLEETSTGYGFESRRAVFAQPLDSARSANVMRALLTLLPGAAGDSIEGFDGRDLSAPVRYRIFFSGARGTTQSGGLHLFTFPFGVLPATNRIRAIEERGARTTSINAEEVLRNPPPSRVVVDMRVTLPDGWRVRVPDDVVVESDFGTYATEYSQDGNVLRIVRTEASAVGIHPPDRLPDVLAFFRAISADENNRTIVIEPPAR
jgi:cellulose synthase operon protein C